MTNPFHDLQKILGGASSLQGRVISIGDAITKIATARGIVEILNNGLLKVGDLVVVRGDRAVKIQNAQNVPVYFV